MAQSITVNGHIEASNSTVKASMLHGIKDLRIVGDFICIYPDPSTHMIPLSENRSLPSPGLDEVQVAVQTTGLCGSDLHYFNHYRNGDIIVQEPLTLGHESAGVVVAIGSQVKGFEIGDKVALEVGLPCMECELCQEGRYNICKKLRFRSSAKSFPHFQGTLQEKINHPANMCYK